MRKLGHEVTQLVPNWNTDLNSRISGCRISSLSYYLIHPLPTVFKTQKLNTSSKFLEIAHLTSIRPIFSPVIIMIIINSHFFKKTFFDVDQFFLSLYWICYTIASVLCFAFLAARHVGIFALGPEIEPTPPALEGEVLTPGPPGKSLAPIFLVPPFLHQALCRTS